MNPDPKGPARSGTPVRPGGPLTLVVGLIVVLGIVAVFVFRAKEAPETPEIPKPAMAPELVRGLALFKKNCSACHGETGLGDGKAAYLLNPKPRNFSEGTFRLTSMQEGLPSDADLLKTLRRGMPGSSMPSWAHLPEEDLKSLVTVVRHLAIEGKAAMLRKADTELSKQKALEIAKEIMQTGDAVALPARPAKVDAELGRKVFLESCSLCHDKDGRGRKREDMRDTSGNPIHARDFTKGIFKGGSEPKALALRILAGLPGSGMSGRELEAEPLWSLVDFLRGMIEPGAQARVEQVQIAFVAKKVPGDLTANPNSPIWKQAGVARFVPLMPLWWRDDRVEGVTVQMVHNGSKVAIKLTWKDTTKNDRVRKQREFGDGAALQFCESKTPPSFAMGAQSDEVNIWYWRAARQRDIDNPSAVAPAKSAEDKKTHRGTTGEPIFENPAAHEKNPVSARKYGSPVEDLNAGGFGTLTSQGPSMQNIQGAARRNDRDGTWEVVFLRDLKPQGERDVTLTPGGEVRIAIAIWDGQAGDRNGQKSVTIWHRLTLGK